MACVGPAILDMLKVYTDLSAPSSIDADSATTATDDLMADESVVDESVVDESVVDESVVDESVVDESVVDESVVDESAVDESVVDESAVDVQKAQNTATPALLRIFQRPGAAGSQPKDHSVLYGFLKKTDYDFDNFFYQPQPTQEPSTSSTCPGEEVLLDKYGVVVNSERYHFFRSFKSKFITRLLNPKKSLCAILRKHNPHLFTFNLGLKQLAEAACNTLAYDHHLLGLNHTQHYKTMILDKVLHRFSLVYGYGLLHGGAGSCFS